MWQGTESDLHPTASKNMGLQHTTARELNPDTRHWNKLVSAPALVPTPSLQMKTQVSRLLEHSSKPQGEGLSCAQFLTRRNCEIMNACC